jgi:hypothetical protein
MGFWDFDWLPGIKSRPFPTTEAEKQTQRQNDIKLPGSDKDWKKPGDKDVRLPGSGWHPNTPAVLPQRFDPTTASRATQRYLKSAGWNGAVAPQGLLQDWADTSTFKEIGPHRYSLSKWQQQQAQADYGVKAPNLSPELTGDSYRTGRANLADYQSLTPQQQKAMRFNELLINATEADRRGKVAPQEQDPEYRARVAEMFGTEGGSQVYAPNTVALLDKMGMGRLRGQDLDEYLSLDRAYDVNEIKALQPWDATPEIGPYQGYHSAAGAAAQTALDQRQIDLAGSLVEKALADTGITGWSEQARIDRYLGRDIPVDQIPFGWLAQGQGRATDEENAKETIFQNMYDYLSSSSTENLDELWAMGQEHKFTDADYNEIFDYFNLKSLEDDRIGVPEGYRTGAETRSFLGIGG